MKTNKYIKFRIVEKDGKYALQGLSFADLKVKVKHWFFKDFYVINYPTDDISNREQSYWNFIESNHSYFMLCNEYFDGASAKKYNSKSAAHSALNKYIKDNLIEPVAQNTEWKQVDKE